MTQVIQTITLQLPFNIGSVNCYLVETVTGFILIDTGSSNMRAELERTLDNADCQPGDLNLIVITHGDFDHTGNASYLKEKFGSKIAMHAGDLGMVERGDMLYNRKSANIFDRIVAFLSPRLLKFNQSSWFTPDIFLEEGDSLTEYGFDARIISIPGHSRGSIGILTAREALFCGDLFENHTSPGLGSIMDDLDCAKQSAEKLEIFSINRIYPGHGEPFSIQELHEIDRP